MKTLIIKIYIQKNNFPKLRANRFIKVLANKQILEGELFQAERQHANGHGACMELQVKLQKKGDNRDNFSSVHDPVAINDFFSFLYNPS